MIGDLLSDLMSGLSKFLVNFSSVDNAVAYLKTFGSILSNFYNEHNEQVIFFAVFVVIVLVKTLATIWSDESYPSFDK